MIIEIHVISAPDDPEVIGLIRQRWRWHGAHDGEGVFFGSARLVHQRWIWR